MEQQVDPHTQNLIQLVVARLIEGGVFDRHLTTLRAEHRRRRDAVVKALQKHAPPGALRFSIPDGGLFLWCRLVGEARAVDVQQRALGRAVFVVTGEPFFVDGGGTHQPRVCFTTRPADVGALAAKTIAESVLGAGHRTEWERPLVRMV